MLEVASWLVVFVLALKDFAVRKKGTASALTLSKDPLSLETVSVGIVEGALAILLVVFPVSDVFITVSPFVGPLSVELVVIKVSNIDISVVEYSPTVAFDLPSFAGPPLGRVGWGLRKGVGHTSAEGYVGPFLALADVVVAISVLYASNVKIRISISLPLVHSLLSLLLLFFLLWLRPCQLHYLYQGMLAVPSANRIRR